MVERDPVVVGIAETQVDVGNASCLRERNAAIRCISRVPQGDKVGAIAESVRDHRPKVVLRQGPGKCPGDLEISPPAAAAEKRREREARGLSLCLGLDEIAPETCLLELRLREIGLADVSRRETPLLRLLESRKKIGDLAQPLDRGLSAQRIGVRRSRVEFQIA